MKSNTTASRREVILDDDGGNGSLKEEKKKNKKMEGSFISNRGTNREGAIRVEEYSEERELNLAIHASLFLTHKSESKAHSLFQLVQSVDDYDDNDEIRSVPLKRFRSSSSKKPKKTFSGPSLTEMGESSFPRVAKICEAKVNMFVCEICADHKAHHESFTIKGCTHSYCFDCIRNYVVSKLENGISQINCPVFSCHGLLEPEYCHEVLPPEVIDRWGNALCESMIPSSQKFYCPFKDCSVLLVDDGEETVTRSECPNCWRLFCAQCKVVWHEGIVCEEYQKLNMDERGKEDIMLRELARNKKWQRCPTCKFYVERTEGCLFMKCSFPQ